MNEVFYFGSLNGDGHYLWTSKSERLHHESHSSMPHDFPCRIHVLDNGLIPVKSSDMLALTQGVIFTSFINGWTILSFLDSSGDKRPGSCSVFIMNGVRTVNSVLDAARASYPNLFERFNFAIIPYEEAKSGLQLRQLVEFRVGFNNSVVHRLDLVLDTFHNPLLASS